MKRTLDLRQLSEQDHTIKLANLISALQDDENFTFISERDPAFMIKNLEEALEGRVNFFVNQTDQSLWRVRVELNRDSTERDTSCCGLCGGA